MHYQACFVVIDVRILCMWWLPNDLQISKILIITAHMINRTCYHPIRIWTCILFCTFLHHYCTLLYFIISNMNSGAHRLGLYNDTFLINEVAPQHNNHIIKAINPSSSVYLSYPYWFPLNNHLNKPSSKCCYSEYNWSVYLVCIQIYIYHTTNITLIRSHPALIIVEMWSELAI